MRIVFMGTPDFAVNILTALINSPYEVVGVVTQPDRPVGRKKEIKFTPVKKVAIENNIEVFQPEKIKEDFQKILDWKPDLIITAAYGQIVPNEVLDYPQYKCINVHASLLPKYRGGAPIHKSIINSESETGVTIMYMVEKMDAGDIISQQVVKIEDCDNVGTLHDKLAVAGSNLLIETLSNIFTGNINPIKQDEDLVTYAWNIKREEELIDWNKSARQIFNQIRGLNPWPGAYTHYNDKNVKVWNSELTFKYEQDTPGTIIAIERDGIVVSANDGAIKILEIQIAGKKRISVLEYLRGNNIFEKNSKFI